MPGHWTATQEWLIYGQGVRGGNTAYSILGMPIAAALMALVDLKALAAG